MSSFSQAACWAENKGPEGARNSSFDKLPCLTFLINGHPVHMFCLCQSQLLHKTLSGLLILWGIYRAVKNQKYNWKSMARFRDVKVN